MRRSNAEVGARARIVRPASASDHSLLFYEDDVSLIETVSEFVASGLRCEDRVILIAAPAHVLALRESLAELELELDVDAALGSGQLEILDVEEMLSSLFADPARSRDRFADLIARRVAEARYRSPRGQVRVFEEMVDLLCRDRKAAAALRLEELWSDLAKATSFRLLRAYLRGVDRVTVSRDQATTVTPPIVAAGDAVVQGAQPDEASFRLLVDGMGDHAIFMLDRRGVVATWNTGASRIKGYAAQEIIGHHFSCFYLAEDVAAGRCERELELASLDGRFEDEGWRLRKDGSRFWASFVLTALRDKGELIGFAKVTRDLTERRRAEEVRQRLAQAQEANRMKDDFLATVSHELRTPLNAILGWSVLLEDRATDPATAKILATIARNAQAQARLIDDLLDVSRIIAGKVRLELKPGDLVTIVREAIEAVRPTMTAKGLELRFECEEQVARIVADPARLEQVVWNLLSNSVKFTERGGEIVVRLGREDGELRLSVRDSGRGIEPEFLPHVFDRFRQADGAAIRNPGGLGLGLAIVQHLVQLHGGRITVVSDGPGKGATFTVALPERSSVLRGSLPTSGAGTRKTGSSGR